MKEEAEEIGREQMLPRSDDGYPRVARALDDDIQ
jgi:hypothetical protein